MSGTIVKAKAVQSLLNLWRGVVWLFPSVRRNPISYIPESLLKHFPLEDMLFPGPNVWTYPRSPMSGCTPFSK